MLLNKVWSLKHQTRFVLNVNYVLNTKDNCTFYYKLLHSLLSKLLYMLLLLIVY